MDAAFKIVVVIPTFRPESPVGPLARAAAHQAMEVVVVDDGTAAPLDELPEGVHMIFCRENRGIASALNAGVGRAMELGATHVLTLDQDSMIDGDFVPDMRDNWVAAESLGLRPGVMAPDSVGNVVYRGIRRGVFRDVKEVLQSGSMFSLSALDEVGGFDESLVIDGVDTEVCLQLRLRGWDVLTCPLRMEHQLGNAVVIRLAGRSVLLTRHQPFRDYYMTRNRILLIRRHWRAEPFWCLGAARRLLTALVLTLALDSQRKVKARAIALGFRDGVANRSGALLKERRAQWSQ